jgi:hypothetical protein
VLARLVVTATNLDSVDMSVYTVYRGNMLSMGHALLLACGRCKQVGAGLFR